MSTPHSPRARVVLAGCVLGLLASLPAAAASAPASSFKFEFGAAQAAPGYVLVPADAVYSAEKGYGFEPGAAVNAVTGDGSGVLAGAVTSAKPFAFSVAVPEGNYRVTVTLGDPKEPATATVKAEARRLMVEHLRTEAGQFATRTFTVNVRRPAISTGGEVNLDSREMNLQTHQAISLGWDDKLTITFSDTHPAVAALDIRKVDDAITVFVLGDSTVTDQASGPGSSWGQMFTRWFKPGVAVANHAESGETLKGFLKERRWDKVLDLIKPGDYVIIEFGTNDSKKSGPQNMYPNQDFAETYAEPGTTYKELLKRFAADAQKKGAFPIIVSPSARRQDNLSGPGSLAPYARAAMDTAKEIGVPAIDLNLMGREINTALGAEAPKQFNDQTHHVEYGSYLQSKCIALGIQQDRLPLAAYLVDDFKFDPNHPEPTPENFMVPTDATPGGRRGRGRAGGEGGRGRAQAPAETPARN